MVGPVQPSGMTRTTRAGFPHQKNPRGNAMRDHSPSDRRHAHPAGQPGMDAARRDAQPQDKK